MRGGGSNSREHGSLGDEGGLVTGARRRLFGAALAIMAVAGVVTALWLLAGEGTGRRGADAARADGSADAARGPVAEGFAGSEACARCHTEQHEAWRGSTHGRAGGPPGPETVIAPFDGTPMILSDARVTPAVEATGAYVFLVDRPGRPRVRYTVDGVVGRGHMLGGGTQGFVSAFDDGTVRFLPFDFSATEGVWFCNTAAVAGWWISGGDLASLRPDVGWVPISDTLKLTDCGDWPPIRILGTDDRFANCQNCHGSQIQVAYDSAASAYETTYTGLDINCESCHGPAREHVARADGGFTDADIGLASLVGLDKEESVKLCLSCHALKRRLEPGYLPGEPLEEHFSLKAPLIGDRPFTPDGRVRTFAYQQNHLYSACYYAGSMTCVDCHDPHGQGYRDHNRRPLAGPFDDGQCTGCHASKIPAEPHTFHPTGSDGVRCVACHMPYLQQPVLGERIPYARSDHSISIPRPLLDDEYGITGACAQCHTDRTPSRLQRDIEERWGRVKPPLPIVEALLGAEADPALAGEAEALSLLRPGSAVPIAQVAALNHLFTEYFRPGVSPPDAVSARLRLLATSPDPDVAAAALAALDLTEGDGLLTRAFLDEALRAPAPRADRIRARWALVLTLVADVYRRQAEIPSYVAALEAAWSVRPSDPEGLLNLGAAYAETGRTEEAMQHYIRSVQLDTDNAVALVNLGLLLESMGRVDEAEGAYRRAIEVRPSESLAHLNLGNVHLRRSDFAAAIGHYEEAVRYDRGMALAHFYKAVAHVQLGDLASARRAVRSAAEFAPDDPQVRDLLEQLSEDAGRQD